MPNVVSFSKILVLIIFFQWGMFLSAQEGGVIVPLASMDEPRGAAGQPLLSCGAEFARFGEQRSLSREDASEFVPPLLPTSLGRASSPAIDSRDIRPMRKSSSFQREMYTLESRAGAVVAIAVFSDSDSLPVAPVVGHVGLTPCALTLPNEVGAEDALPAASPITRAAHQLSSFATTTLMTFPDKFTPEDFDRFQEMIGPMVTAFLGTIMKGERDSVEAVGKRITALEAQIWRIFHDALDENRVFKWGTIPAYSAIRKPACPYLTGLAADEFYLVRSVLEKFSDPKEDLDLYMRDTITREAFKDRLEKAMVESERLLTKLESEHALLKRVAIVTKPIIPQYYGDGEC